MQIVRKMTYSETNLQVVAKVLIICIAVAILGALVSQPVYAENTYLIRDGAEAFEFTSAKTEPAAVLAEAGVLLAPADTFTAATTEGGETEIIVNRLQLVSLTYLGARYIIGTYGSDVEHLLWENGIELDGNDRVSAPIDAKTFNGMHIEVTRVDHEIVEYDQVLPHEVLCYADASMAEGDTVYLSEGSDGLAKQRVRITYRDGREFNRELLGETVVTEPIGEVSIQRNPENPAGTAQAINCLGTAYSCDGRPGITATGTVVHIGTIAVDPKVIPLGSSLYVVSNDGVYDYGFGTAEDTGGLIKGNRVDLYMNTTAECFQFGARRCTVYVLK